MVVVKIPSSPEVVNASQSASAEDEAEIEVSSERSDNPLYKEAGDLVRAGQWSKAEEVYQRLLKEAPSSQLYNDIGVMYFRQKKYSKAESNFTKALAIEPVYVLAYLNRGRVKARQFHHQQAIKDYDALIAVMPFHFDAHYFKAMSEFELKHYQRAADLFKKSSEMSGGENKSRALYRLALTQVALKQVPQAMKSLNAAIRIRPSYLDARITLVSLLAANKETASQAEEEIAKILRLAANDATVYSRVGGLYSDLGLLKKAMESYKAALQIAPEHHLAHYNLGILYLKQKKWPLARAEFEITKRIAPNDSRNYFNLGRAAFGEEDYVGALDYYRKALELEDGQYPKAIFNMAITYRAMNDYKQAIKHYQKAVEMQPDYFDAWNNLGIAYLKLDNNEEAIKALTEALKIDPENASAWYVLGRAYSRLEDKPKAIDAYENAVKFDPLHLKAKLNLAINLVRQEDFPRAVSLYQSIVENDPTYARAWMNMGVAQINLKKYEDAAESLKTFLELESGSARGYLYLARAQVGLKDYEHALETIEQGLGVDVANSSLRLELGRVYKRMGELDKAREEFDKGLRISPNNEELKRERATL
ncbi:MAG: tetratricopeptide repeat protein [Gammaproteobacteria bacterium]|nr:tetratricopeptide repeat protein [Gammaproteobacteria bacterium]